MFRRQAAANDWMPFVDGQHDNFKSDWLCGKNSEYFRN